MNLSDEIIKKIQEEINRRGGMIHSIDEINLNDSKRNYTKITAINP